MLRGAPGVGDPGHFSDTGSVITDAMARSLGDDGADDLNVGPVGGAASLVVFALASCAVVVPH